MTEQRSVGVALENRLMSHGIYVTSVTVGENGDAETGDRESSAERDDTASTPASDAAAPDAAALDDGTPITLEYETVSEVAGVTSDEVGAVLRALLAIADEREWRPGRLDVTSLTTAGERRGRWHVEREWFERLSTDLSEVEFSQLVLETVRQDALSGE